MLLKIHPENPNQRHINTIIECLKDGGTIIYPTDTVYGLGANIYQNKALNKIAQIKGVATGKTNFSLICFDLSHISDFTKPFGNDVFKTMKALLPGPFTFILNANNNVPNIFKSKKKTIGIRVPDNNIVRTIVQQLGNPIVTTSIKDDDDEILEYITDPELIYEIYGNQVDIVIDGGYGDIEPSTVIDCTTGIPEVIRQGKGKISL